jgi:hypothetical protein
MSAVGLALALAGCGHAAPFEEVRVPGCNAIPMRAEEGLLLVDVQVGDATVPVIVDTGSVQTLTLLPEDFARLGLVFDGAERTVHDAKGHALQARGARAAELHVGAAVFDGVRVWEAAHAPDWAPPVRAGHIGRGLLDALRITVDAPNGRLHADGPACPREPGTTIAAQVTSNGWITRAEVGSRPLDLVWDTAATTSILRRDRVPEGVAASEEGVAVSVAPGVTARFVPLELEGLPADGLVGGDVFRSRRVTFEPGSERIVVGPEIERR